MATMWIRTIKPPVTSPSSSQFCQLLATLQTLLSNLFLKSDEWWCSPWLFYDQRCSFSPPLQACETDRRTLHTAGVVVQPLPPHGTYCWGLTLLKVKVMVIVFNTNTSSLLLTPHDPEALASLGSKFISWYFYARGKRKKSNQYQLWEIICISSRQI